MLSKITVSPAPHISKAYSTRSIMLDVIIALTPAVAASVIYFRYRAAIIIATCVLVCLLTEWLCNTIRKKPNSLDDCSAILTGLILALSLPPAIPIWAASIGSIFAIAIGKMVFGGLGSNIFNPAMAGRLFLTASFGALMTTWTVPATVDPGMSAISATGTEAVTQATPLAWSKEAIKGKAQAHVANQQLTASFLGNTGGCLGETSTIALLLGGIYLLIKRTITFHIPAAVLLSAFVCASIGFLLKSEAYVSPLLHLTSGGMLICAFFIATDPVTAPLSQKGMWIFGAGVGVVTMLIRMVGEYPEGIMFAVFLMNAVTPLIDRFCKLKPAGGVPHG
ncbi:MAG: RnfABCDGE type electron transport complex subunit D [Sedimentisphaerales bacterium]|nr:RnfABCDGE type electron transport complex subunit D [Sedimentisphaerales bacterium]